MRNLVVKRVLYGVCLRVVLLLLTAAGAGQSLHAEIPEMHWQEVYPYPTASWLNAAAWGPPGFVAVGSGGEILVSVDGLQWQKSTNGVPKGTWFSDVCFYNGRYVALGDYSEALLWSTNGLIWQQVSTGTNTWLRACAGGDGQYVIAAGNNTLLVSSNAVDWQPRAVPENFLDIVYGSNQWAAVTGGSGIYLSTDLWNWTNTNPSLIPNSGPCFETVCFGEGKFVVGGAWKPDQLNSLYGSVIYFSSNGVTWTTASLSGLDAFGEVKSSVFAAGQFVAVQAGNFLKSTNGRDWAKIPTIDAGGALQGITSSSAGRFLAVGQKGAMLRSDDAQTWTAISVNPRDDLHGVAYADGRFVAVGGSPYSIGGPVGSAVVLTSTNGNDWRASLTNLEDQLSAVAYGNGLWVVCGDNGGIFASGDGLNWTNNSLPPTSHDLHQLVYGNGRFVAFAAFQNLIYHSTNAVDWVSADAPEVSHLAKVRYINGRFIGVGGDDDGFIFSSADGLTWDKTTLVGTGWLEAVTYGKGRYVAAGRSVSAISFDGTNWSVYPVPVSINDLQYVDGWFIGGMAVSRDGVQWEMADNPGAVVYGGGVLVASGGMSLYRGTLNDSEDFNKRLRLLSPAQLEFFGASGFEYRLEQSPDLLNWVPVSSWTTGSNDCLVWDTKPFLSPTAFWRTAGRPK